MFFANKHFDLDLSIWLHHQGLSNCPQSRYRTLWPGLQYCEPVILMYSDFCAFHRCTFAVTIFIHWTPFTNMD